MSKFFLFAVVSAGLGGCFLAPKGPSSGAVATGQPLAVVDDIKVWTTQTSEKVGTAVSRDANGDEVGTTDVYAPRTEVHSKPIWYAAQGKAQISDEDFFRIAGDQASHDTTSDAHRRARRRLRIGQVALVGGVVTAFSALVVPNVYAKSACSLGGLAIALGGWYLAHGASAELESDHHVIDRSIAERDAAEYNQRLSSPGASVSLGVSGQF